MIVTLFCLLVFISTYFLNRWLIKKDSYRGWDGTIAAGVFLVILLLSILISQYNLKVRIAEYESRKETIAQQRDLAATEYERVMLTQEIIDANAWLANIKKTRELKAFNWWVPNKINTLTPIK